jgi:coenzyme PQQ synthesis protein D (PqqD)
MTATPTDRVVVADGVLCRDLDDGAVLLNVETGAYFDLNAVGAAMWRAIVETATLADAIDLIAREYQGAATAIREDLLRLADDLMAACLLQRAAGAPAVSRDHGVRERARNAYAPPVLSAHRRIARVPRDET